MLMDRTALALHTHDEIRERYGTRANHPPTFRPALRLLGCIQAWIAQDQLAAYFAHAREAHSRTREPGNARDFAHYFSLAITPKDHYDQPLDVTQEAAWHTMLAIHHLVPGDEYVDFIDCAIAGWNEALEVEREFAA